MASSIKNLSDYKQNLGVNLSYRSVAIVVSSYYTDITEALYEGARNTLLAEGLQEKHLTRYNVPGAYELTLAAQWAAQQPDTDAVICLGCVIQGQTKHFDFICSAIAHGLTDVALKYSKPVIFGVLTPDTMQQALDRAGGQHGNKGIEAAAACIQMLGLEEKR